MNGYSHEGKTKLILFEPVYILRAFFTGLVSLARVKLFKRNFNNVIRSDYVDET